MKTSEMLECLNAVLSKHGDIEITMVYEDGGFAPLEPDQLAVICGTSGTVELYIVPSDE